MPIGISDFKKIISEDFYYVDKSLLIREILTRKTGVTLISRPRRFGKTLNLSMLQYFFERSDESHADLFAALAIKQFGTSGQVSGLLPLGLHLMGNQQ